VIPANYTGFTITFTTPGAVAVDTMSMYIAALDVNGGNLPRVPAVDSSLNGSTFAWTVGYNWFDPGYFSDCYFMSVGQATCTLYVPKCSIVHQSTHFGDQGNMFWSCNTAGGGTKGTTVFRDLNGNVITPTTEPDPPGAIIGLCRFKFPVSCN
jgi:hypothetical protein